MSEDSADWTMILIIALTVGVPTGMLLNSIILPQHQSTDFIEEIKQAQEDCKIKEYYYMDTHRSFCDKLGVSP